MTSAHRRRGRPVGGIALLLLVQLVAVACGDDDCTDLDGDGHGPGCDRGSDCDDTDPELQSECTEEPPDCEATPFAHRCPCLTGMRRDCFEGGDEASADVGVCRAGTQMCISGIWSTCEGQILPTGERCDGEDDDCDGIVDEDALSPCGGCNPQCRGGVWGSIALPFEATDEVDVTRAGELTLPRSELDSSTVWVPNTGEATLSRIDAVDAVEVARYDSGGAEPDRVAVDFHGDAWVLNRDSGGQSSLTKVAGAADACRDGLATSGGPADVLPRGEDACVLFTVDVGDAGGVARSLSVDGTRAPDDDLGGHVWVGLQSPRELWQLDGRDGSLLRTVDLGEVEPHTSTFDPWGTLWVLDRDGRLGRVDMTAEPPEVEVIEAQLACYELESIASDAQGALTLGGFSCENVIRYDPATDRWRDVATPGVLGARGVTVLEDESWVAHTAGKLSRVGHDPLAFVDTFDLGDDAVSPLESIALGADSLGQLWVVSSRGAADGNGVVTRFDPGGGAVTAQVPVGRAPRGQGDLTGSRRLTEFVPEGAASHVFEGCGPGPATEWRRLHVAWAAGPGASVAVDVRQASDEEELSDVDFERLGVLPRDTAPFDVALPEGGVVEVRLTLAVEGRLGAPRVARVGLEWHCPGPE